MSIKYKFGIILHSKVGYHEMTTVKATKRNMLSKINKAIVAFNKDHLEDEKIISWSYCIQDDEGEIIRGRWWVFVAEQGTEIFNSKKLVYLKNGKFNVRVHQHGQGITYVR